MRPTGSFSLFRPIRENLRKHGFSGGGRLPPQAFGQNSDKVFHLRFAQPCVHGRAHMEPELTAKTGNAGERGDCRQFAALVIQIVADKDIGKKTSITGAKS